MKTLSIAYLFDSFEAIVDDHCVYVFRANDDILYVGQSENKDGILKRVADHIQLKRRPAGNFIYIKVNNMHQVAAAAHLRQFLVGVTHRPEWTTFHVKVAGIVHVHEVRTKYDIKWGDDKIGRHVLDNYPKSREWQIDLYTFGDCCPNLLRFAKAYGIEPQPKLGMAEDAMIHYLKPRLNNRIK